MTLPLEGIRVIEIGQNLAGPFAALILGRLGADVIKVERPTTGDDCRGWGPPFVDGSGTSFHSMNAGKRSIALDLTEPGDTQVLRRHIGRADVLVQNLRAGVLQALGLGAEACLALNPRLIYCNVSAFGPNGPLRDRPGYEPMMQAFTGLMMVGGTEGDPPGRIGVPILDYGTGMWAAIGVLAALALRARSGRGAVVDASLFDTAFGWFTGHYAFWRAAGRMQDRHPTGSSKLVPFQAFETKTGPLVIAAGNDRLFASLARALARPEWATDPRYTTSAARYRHKAALLAAIEAILKTRPRGEWLDVLEAAGVPCAPVNTLTDILEHPQTMAAGVVQPVADAALDSLIGLPLRLDGVRPPIQGRAPRIGEHDAELREER